MLINTLITMFKSHHSIELSVGINNHEQDSNDDVHKTANRIRFLEHKAVEVGPSPQLGEIRQLQTVRFSTAFLFHVLFDIYIVASCLRGYASDLFCCVQVLARCYHLQGAGYKDLTNRLFEIRSQLPENLTQACRFCLTFDTRTFLKSSLLNNTFRRRRRLRRRKTTTT